MLELMCSSGYQLRISIDRFKYDWFISLIDFITKYDYSEGLSQSFEIYQLYKENICIKIRSYDV